MIRKELRELRLSAIMITKMSARINVVNVQYTLDLYYSAKPVLTEVITGQRVLPCQRSAPRSIKIAVHCYTEAFILGFLWRVSNRKMGAKVTPRHLYIYTLHLLRSKHLHQEGLRVLCDLGPSGCEVD